jgi:DNA-binding Lrp family transcriptional regulator
VSTLQMAVTPFDPDELDIAMLRAMYRDHSVSWAGFDLDQNASRVARALKVGRGRVTAHLERWRSSGFIRRYSVRLNPALHGWDGAYVYLHHEHHRSKPQLFRRLGLIDGVIGAQEFLGEMSGVTIVAPDAFTLGRRIDLVRTLPGVREVGPVVPWHLPESTHRITPVELRLVRALRESPTAPIYEIADKVQTSTRTVTRRYAALVKDWAIWVVPMLDCTALLRPVVSIYLQVGKGADRDRIARELRSRFPMTIDAFATPAESKATPMSFAFYVMLPSPAAQEEFEQYCESLPGVESISDAVLVRYHDYPTWYDQQLIDMTTEARAR